MYIKYTLQESLSGVEEDCLHRYIFRFTAKLICWRFSPPAFLISYLIKLYWEGFSFVIYFGFCRHNNTILATLSSERREPSAVSAVVQLNSQISIINT